MTIADDLADDLVRHIATQWEASLNRGLALADEEIRPAVMHGLMLSMIESIVANMLAKQTGEDPLNVPIADRCLAVAAFVQWLADDYRDQAEKAALAAKNASRGTR
jgi:hypothetical protein